MQVIEKLQPLSVNTDAGLLKLKPEEATFLRNYRIASGRNKSGQMGGNFGVAKKFQSNWPLVLLDLPAGTCKLALFYEHEVLNEAYIGVWNALGKHTLYILYGNTLASEIVYQGPELDWTLDPKNFIAEHRCFVRIIYDVSPEAAAADQERHIREKILFFTDGHGWQRWINVLSAVATKGYDASLFPYYTLHGPHFDKNELIDYAMRPPMFCPVLTALPRSTADLGLTNFLLNKSISFAYRYVNTDGRGSVLSPFSNPFFVARSACAASTSLTRSVDVAMYAGGPHVEQLQVLVRNCGGDWMLYDTLYKFTSDGPNAPGAIGDKYWTRTNPWGGGASNNSGDFTYDAASNTIHYTYSGDRQVTTFSKNDQQDFFNDVPIQSYGLTPAGDALIWANNLFNYNNLPASTLKQFQLSVGPVPNGAGTCSVKNVKITLYAYMARDSYLNQVVYTKGSDPTGLKHFGGISRTSIFGTNPYTIGWDTAESDFFNLDFGNNANFICYLAGTPYVATGVQYLVNGDNTTMTEVGPLDSTNAQHKVLIQNLFDSGGYFVQKFDFNVPAGNYIARLARHSADLTGEYQVTSTYVQGLFDHTQLHGGSVNNDFLSDPVRNFAKEFLIDATQGNVDFWGKGEDLFYVFVPWINKAKYDIEFFGGRKRSYRFIEGHVLEDTSNLLNDVLPVEMVHYKAQYGASEANRGGDRTDHNGFFFQYISAEGSGGPLGHSLFGFNGSNAYKSEVLFYGNFKCAYNNYMFRSQINNTSDTGAGYYPGQVVTIQDNYDLPTAQSTRIVVTGKVVNCDSGIGIPSIGITLTDGPTFYTDSNGAFTYYARGYYSFDRTGSFYINGGGACLFVDCNCGPVATLPFTTAGIPCDPSAPRIGPGGILFQLKLLSQTAHGLKGGGRYGIAVNLMDLAGRTTFSQPIGYVNIPTFMETGVFTQSQISWSLSGPLNLPDFVKYFTLSRTVNLASLPPLQWVGDKIDFINNKGELVPDGVGAIRARITIQSLLNFNIESNFNTNVNYQFVTGDIVRIMDDGTGNLFAPAANNGFLDYQVLGTTYNQSIDAANSNQALVSSAVAVGPGGTTNTKTTSTVNPVNANDDGVSFVIEFDERLLVLRNKTGFWIELRHPRDLETIETYCEVVTTIPVIDGEPAITSGVLDTFDTYLQQRSIRIPNALGQNFAHPFESGSVTDYSQANCGSCGRRNVADPLAKQTWYENETMESDQIINEGRVNGLGRCRTANRKNFKGQSFGGIVAVHAERNRLIFICERDWFVTDYEMNYVRVTQQGLLQSNADQTISNPFPKEGSVFGCAYEDTASVVFYDGTSIWADRFNAAVIALDYRHNQSVVPMGYRDAVDITAQDTKSYFINKFNYMLAYNASLAPEDYLANLMEIVAGIDPQTGEYNITFRPRNGLKPDPQYFVNDEREVFYDMAETFVYNPDFKKWVSFAGYAPEFYGKLSGSVSGQELIAFAAGQPWFHNTIGKPGSMNFFGVQTNQVIEVALNTATDKVKIFQNLIVSSADTKYFADRVLTEDRRFSSYVPKAHFKRKEQVLYAPFLCNMGTYPDLLKPVASMLMDGKRTFGKVALVRLVSDPEEAVEYGELESISYRVTGSELSGK